MRKQDAYRSFKESVLPYVALEHGVNRDHVHWAWSDYTESLARDGQITPSQRAFWIAPKVSRTEWIEILLAAIQIKKAA